MTIDEYNAVAEGVWGEINTLKEVVGRSFESISDEDYEFLRNWFLVFLAERGREITIIDK